MANVSANLPAPTSRKNKILVAIGVVVIGHAGILFALSQMQPAQLKPIVPPKPIQVRLIQEQKVQPPKPVEPPKPKEVKVVETPPPPPKKVEKVEQVKKDTPKPKVAEPPKPTKVETPIHVETPVVPPKKVETPKVTPVQQPVTPAPAPVAPPVPLAPVTPTVDMTPRNLGDAAGVAWKRSPKPKLIAGDLDKVTNNVVVLRIDVDAKGKIQARVVQSSGSPKVDREMVRAVQAASFQPYKENGVAVPFYAEQPFRVQ